MKPAFLSFAMKPRTAVCVLYGKYDMKGRDADMKKVLLTTPVLTLIITAVLALVENVAGFVVGIIPLGMGGDCMAAVSLGGNVVMYSFPVTAVGESGGVSSEVIFNIIVFLIAFCVRTLILHLAVGRKHRIRLFLSDYVE